MSPRLKKKCPLHFSDNDTIRALEARVKFEMDSEHVVGTSKKQCPRCHLRSH